MGESPSGVAGGLFVPGDLDPANDPFPTSGLMGTRTVARPKNDLTRSMMLTRERLELIAERIGAQVIAMNEAKMEAFGYCEDSRPTLDASSFEDTLHGRIGLVEHQLDRLEDVFETFGTTH